MDGDDEKSRITIVLQDAQTHGGILYFDEGLEAALFWSWYETIKKWGVDQAHEMAILSVKVAVGNPSEHEQKRLRKLLQDIEFTGDIRPDRETWARRLSYNMLARGDWNRHDAARFATNILGRDIKESTWREAVNKWAKEQGKPRLTLPRGRPVQNKAQDN